MTIRVDTAAEATIATEVAAMMAARANSNAATVWHKDWKKCEEKQMLRGDIMAGIVTEDTLPSEAYNMHNGAYHGFKPQNFYNNFRNLRTAILKQIDRAVWDRDAILNDRALHPKKTVTSGGLLRWNGSDGERMLKQELQKPKYEKYFTTKARLPTPERKTLHESKDEFYAFEYKRFSGFIGQVIQGDRRVKKKKAKSKAAKRSILQNDIEEVVADLAHTAGNAVVDG